jgi:broad specificity phosphatase PhoE
MGVAHFVRHGQASFGAPDYDVLSPAGATQSRLLGTALAARAIPPQLVVAGGLRRQQDTAALAMDAMGYREDLLTDRAWDEFDHERVLRSLPGLPPAPSLRNPRSYQAWFERATGRWADGTDDADYDETFRSFCHRVEAGLAGIAETAAQGGTVLVVTSGGVIAWVAASLLGATAVSWVRLSRVVANTGITTVTFGESGSSLVTFNEHSHLPRHLLTYR